MVYYDYKCGTCGFVSEEELAVYQCPICGNMMGIRTKKNNFSGAKSKRFSIFFFESFLLLAISVCYFPIGIIISIVIVMLTRKFINDKYKDKAIRLYSTEILNNSWKTYTCPYCGKEFQGQRPNCPYCGGMVNYADM